MNKAIVVFGGSRRNGNTGKLIDWIAKELDVEVIDLNLKSVTPYDYEHKNIDDDFVPLIDRVLKHNNIIFASPVYWYSMSAQMKVFIDRTSDLLDIEELKARRRALRGKVGYVAATSISEHLAGAFIDSFTNTFDYLGLEYGGCIHANCENGFNRGDLQNDVNDFVKRLNLSGFG